MSTYRDRSFMPTMLAMSFTLGGIRVLGVTHQFFQAITLVWVGMLIMAWLMPYILTNGTMWHQDHDMREAGRFGRLAGWTLVWLTVLEVGCALWFRFGA